MRSFTTSKAAYSWIRKVAFGTPLTEFRRSVELRPDFVEARMALGIQMLSGGNYSEALQQFQAAVGLAPTSVEAHLNLGDAYRANKQWQQAKASFDRALSMRSNLPQAHFNMGLMYMSAGAEFPGLDQLGALRKAVEEFTTYRNAMGPRLGRDDPAEGYLEDLNRQIEREQRRIQRDRERAQREAGPRCQASSGWGGKPMSHVGARTGFRIVGPSDANAPRRRRRATGAQALGNIRRSGGYADPCDPWVCATARSTWWTPGDPARRNPNRGPGAEAQRVLHPEPVQSRVRGSRPPHDLPERDRTYRPGRAVLTDLGVYHGLQLVLAAGVACLVAWRLRILCFVTALGRAASVPGASESA